ncbi:hypothetical protein ACHAQA_005958 [Verticillium albo-atrum]
MAPEPLTQTRPPEVNGDLTTVWIPLETAYPSHASCGSLFWRLDKQDDTPIVAWDPGYELWVDPSASCQPPAVSSWWHAEDRADDIILTRWSLGPLVCPEAYTTATTSDAGGGSTLVGCCPSDYSFVSFVGPNRMGECTSDIRPNQVITWAEPVSAMSGKWEYTSFAPEISSVFGLHINGWVFNAVDAEETAAPGTSGDRGSQGGGGGGGGGWSTTKMVVAVGVPLGVLALAGLALALFFYRRRARPETSEPEFVEEEAAGLPAPSVSPVEESQAKIDGEGLTEVPSVERPREVLSEERPLELVNDERLEMPAGPVLAELPAKV